MDSKYTAVGREKEQKSLYDLKVKRLKLSIENTVKNNREVEQNACFNGVRQDNTSKSNNDLSNDVSEDLQEARKTLPVYQVKARLLEEVRKHKTMILIGETGSGKTTQIPQIIHEQRLEGKGCIAVTQPRRVAAITLALRVAAETNSEIGSIVGYTVRFEDVTSPQTKVKYLTDGMLLREAMNDPLLKKYSVIILDEAHERTVNTDVLFGIVKLAQKERDEQKINTLKVIIMSATMDVDAFRKYYDNCPVIYLEGRTYPVTIYHSKMKHEDYQYAAVCTIFQLHATTPANHDFLVFLTGQEEIETVMSNIKHIAKEAKGPQIRVLPLYAGLPATKQLQVWKKTPPGMRKIVLATNIAEASVTIPQIKFVIDTGVVKERTWCTSTGAERLVVRACSQAAGWQRAGRAGRTTAGAAYRLYTAADFGARQHHNTPEIVRCPLASTMLMLIAAGMDPSTFPLLDSPPRDSIQAALLLLKEIDSTTGSECRSCREEPARNSAVALFKTSLQNLIYIMLCMQCFHNEGKFHKKRGAIDNENNPKLSVLGKKMTAFPIEPKYSKVLLCAPEYNCLEEALSLVAVMSSENVFHTPLHKREEALKVKQKFISPLGDHITLLNVYKAFCKAPLKKQWCRENYLNHKNLSYAFDIRQQLLAVCQRLNMTVTSCGSALDQLLKCLLSGLFTNCAWARAGAGGGGRYVTSAGVAAMLHPSGVLQCARPAPPAVLYTELLHTRRSYLVTVSAIQPQWLHQVAPEYARRCRANR